MLELPNEVRIQGHKIRWGVQGDGPAMVAIHGTPFSSQVWRRIIPQIAHRYRVYYFDLAGYGQSEMRARQDVSLGVQNAILADLLGHWALKTPHILCHDFGGATALRGFVLNGLSYASLTIFDAVALAPWGSPFVQHVRQHEEAFAKMPGYMHDAMLRAYLQTSATQPLTEEAFNIYADPWRGDVGQPAFYRQIAQMDQVYTDEIADGMGQIDYPVTVLWGEDDQWIPVSQGEKLAAFLKAQTFRKIPNCGHLMQEDAPEAIVSAALSL